MKTHLLLGSSLFILVLFGFSLQFGFSGEVHIFKNRDGKTLEAEYLSEILGSVRIKRIKDGKVFSLKIDSLSEADQKWLKEQKGDKKEKEKSQSIEGLWGGKWDDKWPMFITIKAGDSMGHYRVVYAWKEYLDQDFSSMTQAGEEVDEHIHSSLLYFKLSGDSGMVYGKFSTPRMANLVRITDGDKALEEVNLEDYGWKEGYYPASEAYRRITGELPDE